MSPNFFTSQNSARAGCGAAVGGPDSDSQQPTLAESLMAARLPGWGLLARSPASELAAGAVPALSAPKLR